VLQHTINPTRQSITQLLFYIHWHICQGDMFWPSRSSSGPPRKQIQELFSFSALWDPKCSHVSVIGAKKYVTLYKLNLLCAYRHTTSSVYTNKYCVNDWRVVFICRISIHSNVSYWFLLYYTGLTTHKDYKSLSFHDSSSLIAKRSSFACLVRVTVNTDFRYARYVTTFRISF